MDVFEKAHKMVSDLCQGRKDWIMSIPVDEERDPDVVISKAIMAGMDAQAESDQRLELLKRFGEFICHHPDCVSWQDDDYCDCGYLDLLDELQELTDAKDGE